MNTRLRHPSWAEYLEKIQALKNESEETFNSLLREMRQLLIKQNYLSFIIDNVFKAIHFHSDETSKKILNSCVYDETDLQTAVNFLLKNYNLKSDDESKMEHDAKPDNFEEMIAILSGGLNDVTPENSIPNDDIFKIDLKFLMMFDSFHTHLETVEEYLQRLKNDQKMMAKSEMALPTLIDGFSLVDKFKRNTYFKHLQFPIYVNDNQELRNASVVLPQHVETLSQAEIFRRFGTNKQRYLEYIEGISRYDNYFIKKITSILKRNTDGNAKIVNLIRNLEKILWFNRKGGRVDTVEYFEKAAIYLSVNERDYTNAKNKHNGNVLELIKKFNQQIQAWRGECEDVFHKMFGIIYSNKNKATEDDVNIERLIPRENNFYQLGGVMRLQKIFNKFQRSSLILLEFGSMESTGTTLKSKMNSLRSSKNNFLQRFCATNPKISGYDYDSPGSAGNYVDRNVYLYTVWPKIEETKLSSLLFKISKNERVGFEMKREVKDEN